MGQKWQNIDVSGQKRNFWFSVIGWKTFLVDSYDLYTALNIPHANFPFFSQNKIEYERRVREQAMRFRDSSI